MTNWRSILSICTCCKSNMSNTFLIRPPFLHVVHNAPSLSKYLFESVLRLFSFVADVWREYLFCEVSWLTGKVDGLLPWIGKSSLPPILSLPNQVSPLLCPFFLPPLLPSPSYTSEYVLRFFPNKLFFLIERRFLERRT